MNQSWSERVKSALESAVSFNRTSVVKLVDLLFENPIPMNASLVDEAEIGKLLKYPGQSPAREIQEVKVAVAYQKWIRECLHLCTQIKSTLQSFPNTALKDELLELTIEAAGFELVIEPNYSSHSHVSSESVKHTDIGISQKQSREAVVTLCKTANPVTNNILQKVLTKKDVIVRAGTCTSYTETTVSFSEERQTARTELSNRGNPQFDQNAYFVA